MALQAIVYSLTTGRIRRVIDPELDIDEATLLSHVTLANGEGAHVYTKIGQGKDHLLSWQLAVSAKTGLVPTEDTCRHAVIDKAGNVVGSVYADLNCGDAIPDHRLVKHSSACPGWSYREGKWTPPHPEYNKTNI